MNGTKCIKMRNCYEYYLQKNFLSKKLSPKETWKKEICRLLIVFLNFIWFDHFALHKVIFIIPVLLCIYFLKLHMINTKKLSHRCQVVLIQEQLSKNRIIIDTDKKGKWVALLIFSFRCSSFYPYSRVLYVSLNFIFASYKIKFIFV